MTTRLYIRRPVLFGGDDIDMTQFTERRGTPFMDQNESLVELGMRYFEGQASQGTFKWTAPFLPDTAPFNETFPLGHCLITWTEDASGDEIWLFRGRVANDEGGRGEAVSSTETEWDATVDDGNVDLRGQAFTEHWIRPEETDVERLVALQLFTLNGASSTATNHRDDCLVIVNTSHLTPNTNTVTMPAKKYIAGTQPQDVIKDCAEMAGKGYGVVIHHTGGSHLCLLYTINDDHSTYTTPVKISDQLDDWDPDDPTAPVVEPHWERGPAAIYSMQTLLSGLVSTWGGSEQFVFVENAPTVTAYNYWTESYSDGVSTDAAQAADRAAGILYTRVQTHVQNRVSLILNADQVHLIGTGMSIQLKAIATHTVDVDVYVTRRIAECRFEPRNDGKYWVHLDIERPALLRAPGRGQSGPIPPVQSDPAVVTTDYIWTFQSDLLDDLTSTYSWGNHWHPGMTHTHVLNPGMGNRSGVHPPIADGTFHVRCILNRGGGGYNPGGIRINVYSYTLGVETFRGQSELVTSTSQTSVGFDVVFPAGVTSWSAEVPYNACEVHLVELSHGGAGSGFIGTPPPPASGTTPGGGGSIGTSPIYSPSDHEHEVQPASVTPIVDAGGYFVDSFVEGALQELASGSQSNVRWLDFVLSHRWLIGCHEGGDVGDDSVGGDSWPEDTLEACRQGAEKGADVTDVDVQRNADGSWVLMHDTTVNRTTTSTGNVNAKTDAQWAALVIDGGNGYNATRHGSSLGAPFLTDVLDAIKQYSMALYFDMKVQDTTEATSLAEFLVEHDFAHRSAIRCTTAAIAAAVRAVDSRITTLCNIFGGITTNDDVDIVAVANTDIATIDDVRAYAPKPVISNADKADYGVDETSLMDTLYESGVRIWLTNYLDVALAKRVELYSEHNLGGGGVTDHGALTGLADDDHPQYLTEAEHDLEDHAGLPGVGAGLVTVDPGTVTYDDSGEDVDIAIDTLWGIDGDGSYYDDTGAVDGEQAALMYDPDNDAYLLIPYNP